MSSPSKSLYLEEAFQNHQNNASPPRNLLQCDFQYSQNGERRRHRIRTRPRRNRSSNGLPFSRHNPRPQVKDISVQTEAYAVTDIDLLLDLSSNETENENMRIETDQVHKLLTSVVHQHLPLSAEIVESHPTPRRDIEVSSSVPFNEYAYTSAGTSALTPCLQGHCRFAEELKNTENPVWLGCKYKHPESGQHCKYWIHAKCHGFPKLSQEVAKMVKGFMCPQHNK